MFLTVREKADNGVDGVGWRIIGGPHFLFSSAELEMCDDVICHGKVTQSQRNNVDKKITHSTFGTLPVAEQHGLIETHTIKDRDTFWFLGFWCDPPPVNIAANFSGRIMRDLRVNVDMEAVTLTTPLAPRRRTSERWRRSAAAQ